MLFFKLIIVFIFFSLLLGCSSINNEERICGIVDASYTSIETKKDYTKVCSYIDKKVSNKEISEDVGFTIKTCIKRSEEK